MYGFLYRLIAFEILLKTPKVIAAIATALILLGCSPTRSIQPPQTVVTEQRSPIPLKQESTAIEQTRQPETQKTVAPAYLPCIDGPKAFRFIDGLGVGSIESDKVEHLINQMPPLTKQRLIKIAQDMTFEGMTTGRKVTREASFAEEMAEEYITDCSDRLALLSAAAALPSMSNMPEMKVLIQLWQSNLEFMKWWLTNYRQKHQKVR